MFDDTACTQATDYDSLFACVLKVFNAKESNQSDFQVSYSFLRIKFFHFLNKIVVYRRSSQQIYNVTLFFLFFMSLYGLLGVQFFGELKNHCVMNTTNLE